jgi:hypothetical protein
MNKLSFSGFRASVAMYFIHNPLFYTAGFMFDGVGYTLTALMLIFKILGLSQVTWMVALLPMFIVMGVSLVLSALFFVRYAMINKKDDNRHI